MKEIIIPFGMDIDVAYEKLKAEHARSGLTCWCEFNGKFIYSTDSKSDVYRKVFGEKKD